MDERAVQVCQTVDSSEPDVNELADELWKMSAELIRLRPNVDLTVDIEAGRDD